MPWSLDCRRDLQWWLRGDRFSRDVSLLQVSPVLPFWCDASGVGLGPRLGDRVVSSLWDQWRLFFLSMSESCWLCITVSSTSCPFCQGPRWPCFAAMSPRSPIYSRDVFRSLRRRWPVMFDLCATSDHHRCSIFSRPTETLSRRGRMRSSSPGTVSWHALFRRGPFIPGCWRSLECLTGPSSPSSPSTGLSVLGSRTSSSCRWLLQCLFQRAQTSSSSLGLVAATRVSMGWPFMPGDCPAPHQGGWFLLGGGCAGFIGAPSIISLHLPAQVVGLPVMVPLSGPSLSWVADSLWWLRSVRGLSVSSIKGYRSMLSAVFEFHLPALSSHRVLRDLLRSFRVSAPSYPMRPPSWDLLVLRFLNSGSFEPLRSAARLIQVGSFLACVGYCQACGGAPGAFTYCFLRWW